MKQYRNKKTLIAIIAAGVFVLPNLAHADVTAMITGVAMEHVIFPTLANLGAIALMISTIFLRMTAFLLNQALFATTHMADIVAGTPAIGLIWKMVRDFSSIFLIFMLLFYAITMILGLDTQGFKKLVINIVMAGLLINFSLFFTKLAIDTSNIIALGFYKAIDGASDPDGGATKSEWFKSKDGLANAVMQGLRIQSILYTAQGKGNIFGGTASYFQGVDVKIVIATVMGTAIVIVASLSFLAAAIMFLLRIGVLLLLMAFSPLFFIGMMLPALKPKAKEWLNTLTGQCVFAPLYLMLMYVVLKIMLDPSFGKFMGLTGGNAGITNDSFSSDIFSGNTIGTVAMYVIILLLLNMALLVSKDYANMGAVKIGDIGMKAKGWASSYVGRKTLGRMASNVDERLGKTAVGNSAFGRSLRDMSTGYAANSKYGGSKSYKDDKKLGKEIDAETRKRKLKAELEAAIKLEDSGAIRTALGKMSSTEKQALDKKTLSNPLVMQHIGGSVYSSVDKGDRSDKEKEEIKDARQKAFIDALSNNDLSSAQKMVKNLDKDELSDTIEAGLTEYLKPVRPHSMDMVKTLLKRVKGEQLMEWDPGLLSDHAVAVNLTESQLKDMESLPDRATKVAIGSAITSSADEALGTGYMRKDDNILRWS
ncbi:MAG: hypothetical protein JWO73_872 [Candidatus Taylorbacteria bacterium]|nr:hypothetical protein [Candidatus Taylorbacteria bacterium]